MKKLNWIQLKLIRIKEQLASIGWKMFIYFNNFTEEEYWNRIYEQEKQFKESRNKML